MFSVLSKKAKKIDFDRETGKKTLDKTNPKAIKYLKKVSAFCAFKASVFHYDTSINTDKKNI